MQAFELLEPTSLAEACRLLAERGEGTKLIGGGTALVVLMKQKVYQPECLISTAKVPELQVLSYSDSEGLRLGGGLRHHDAETAPVVQEKYPLLAAALHKVGNIRVRQMATLAGNLSHGDYMSDPPAALVALGARIRLASAEGTRELDLEEFLLGPYSTQLAPGELVQELLVPPPVPGAVSTYHKFAIPTETERPTLNVAVQAVPGGQFFRSVSLVLGAVAGRPVRVRSAEEVLKERPITGQLLDEAAAAATAAIDPIDDGRAPVWYKREITGVLVRRALADVARQMGVAVSD